MSAAKSIFLLGSNGPVSYFEMKPKPVAVYTCVPLLMGEMICHGKTVWDCARVLMLSWLVSPVKFPESAIVPGLISPGIISSVAFGDWRCVVSIAGIEKLEGLMLANSAMMV